MPHDRSGYCLLTLPNTVQHSALGHPMTAASPVSAQPGLCAVVIHHLSQGDILAQSVFTDLDISLRMCFPRSEGSSTNNPRRLPAASVVLSAVLMLPPPGLSGQKSVTLPLSHRPLL